ncbi:NAD(P)/FAD-dependent oxidoreductase [Winogradskyella sp.]|uniref:NAD(P)/FAD-dependent oxidoreductase n=1 Tax=Winogradskyella sp. TaxID=1883156 RepID=UPI003AB2062B
MKNTVSIIGGGPSGFLLAAFLNSEKFNITIYEKNKTAGRKFLVAGKGGFNLTHSEPISQMINRYTPSKFLEASLQSFTNTDFRNWLNTIGIPTYVGSSKRVYPVEGIKPIEVLNAILKQLKKNAVSIKYEQVFSGWDANMHPIINNKSNQADYTIFSLGGGSWKITGSDGNWLNTFTKKGILSSPFKASNCAFQIPWADQFIKENEGKPLKNIAISCQKATQKGEAVITKFGLEGNAIYALSPQIREQLKYHATAKIYLDFKPTLTEEQLLTKIKSSTQKNTTATLKKELKLSSPQINLLKTQLSKESYLNLDTLAKSIKNLPLQITNTAVIDEAISTVGGVQLDAITPNFEIKQLPNQYCIGEMVDWDAPTGGYLLQACASMGVSLAKHLNSSF